MHIFAHRGAHDRFPENSIAAFEQAVSLGADGIEFDVRLTKDNIPVAIHPVEVRDVVGINGYVFNLTLDELQSRPMRNVHQEDEAVIPTLSDVLKNFAARTRLDIEIKALEPEATELIAGELRAVEMHWPTIEITCFEPALIRDVRSQLPAITVDLLIPRSEPWMTPEIVAHMALHRARLAGAHGVHLHPTQLSEAGVDGLREAGIEVHCWGVNNAEHFEAVRRFEITKFDTDHLEEILGFAGRNDDK